MIPIDRVILAGVALALMLAAAVPGKADFYDGMVAYEQRDFATAARELEPLAVGGDARARRLVGLMYRDGLGVPQDFVRAHAWLNLAAAAGEGDAAAERDGLSARMDPGQIAEAQRLASIWQATSATAPAPVVDARPLSGAQITELQWLLAVHGYDPGPADGRDGPGTRRAVRQYQADASLTADGVPTLAVLDHLHFTEPPVRNSRAVAERVAAAPEDGIARIYTVAAQEALAAQGYRPGPIDGITGARTRAAILRYQADHGLPATGRVSLALVNHLRLITGGTAAYSAASY